MSLSLNEAVDIPGREEILAASRDSKILRGAFVHRRGEHAEDERLVADFWRTRGLTVEALEDPKERFSRLPDLLLYDQERPWAYCEVKTVWRHSWMVAILHQDRPKEEREEITTKSVFERLSGDLVTAIRQLRAGNPEHALLNIVVLVNQDQEANLGVLTQLFSAPAASIRPGRGERHTARLAMELQDFCRHVDLCLWTTEQADGTLFVEAAFYFNTTMQTQIERVVRLESEKLIVLEPAA